MQVLQANNSQIYCNGLKKNRTLRGAKTSSFVGNYKCITSRKTLRGGDRSFIVNSKGQDFDTILIDIANKFEKADNKGPIIGWALGAFFGITTVEWLIHLPLFDFLFGFPLQFLGIVSAVNLGLKYYVEKKGDPVSDLEDLVAKVSKQLPGIGK